MPTSRVALVFGLLTAGLSGSEPFKPRLFFEPNAGQAPVEARFVTRTTDASVQILDRGMVIQHRKTSVPVRFDWIGSSGVKSWVTLEPTGGVTNYYTEYLRAPGVPHFASVRGVELYPGIDIRFHGNQRQMEFDFEVSPHADPARIRWSVPVGTHVDADGNLTASDGVRLLRPAAWQELEGKRRLVQVAYSLRHGRAGFRLGHYDPALPLVIDPVNLTLSYSTLIGGAGVDEVKKLVVNSAGEATIAGITTSASFAGATGLRSSEDVYVAKLNSTGTAFLYVTFFGGSSPEELRAFAVDATGISVVGGRTVSANLPLLSPFQTAYGGGYNDGFVAKISPTGAILWSSYFGGSDSESVDALAINHTDGSIVLAGGTSSRDLPVLNGYQNAPPPKVGEGFDTSMFLSKISSSGSRQFLTYFYQPDRTNLSYLNIPSDVAFDLTGAVVVTGQASPGLPNPTGLQTGGPNVVPPPFVARFSGDGSQLLFTRYLESSVRSRVVERMAIDSTNQIYVAGSLSGFDYTAPPDTSYVNTSFVMVLDGKGALVKTVDWLQGTNIPFTTALAFASDFQSMWVIGGISDIADTATDGIPGVVVSADKAKASLSRVNLQTGVRESFAVLGGTEETIPLDIANGPGNTIYIAGKAGAGSFTATPGVVRSSSTSQDGFLTKLNASTCTLTVGSNSWVPPPAGGDTTVPVSASGCAWSAQSLVSWIKVNLPASGTGNGLVSLTADANEGRLSRTGTLLIGGNPFTVTQFGSDCGVIGSNSWAAPATGGSTTVTITAPACAWSVLSLNAWIKVNAPASGTGNGLASLTVDPNGTSFSRSGSVAISGNTFMVTQPGTACLFSLTAQGASLPTAAGTGILGVTVSPGYCAWTLQSSSSWLTLSTSSGNGNATVNFAFSTNPAALPRTASISAGTGSSPVTFTQPANACTSNLDATNKSIGAEGGSFPAPLRFSGAGCDAIVTSNAPWISTAITGGYVGVSIATNTLPSARTGTVILSGKTLTVNQAAGTGCTFTSSPTNLTADVNGILTPVKINLAASAQTCDWSAFTGVRWATLYPASGRGSMTLDLAVTPNFSTVARTASISIGGQTFTISQPGSTESSNARFIRLLYFSALGRNASVPEVASQLTNLTTQGRAAFANGLLNSSEFNLGSRYIAGLYVGLLNRDAEYEGWQFQRSALFNRIVDSFLLADNFITSPEFLLRNGTLSNAEFIRLLYRQILFRDPLATEVDFHLASFTGRASKARDFLQTAEFRIGSGPRLSSFLLSAALLLRSPTGIEHYTRINQLENGATFLSLLQGVLDGPEFASVLQ